MGKDGRMADNNQIPQQAASNGDKLRRIMTAYHEELRQRPATTTYDDDLRQYPTMTTFDGNLQRQRAPTNNDDNGSDYKGKQQPARTSHDNGDHNEGPDGTVTVMIYKKKMSIHFFVFKGCVTLLFCRCFMNSERAAAF